MKKQKNGEKLRIAMVGHKRMPSREGGIEVVVEELSTRLAARGHRVVCYNRGGHHVSGRQYDVESLKEYKQVRIKTVPTLERKGLAAMTSSFFGALFAAFGPYDVVHFHAEGPCAMLWLPKLFGKRCVATVHGLDHQRAKWGRLARTYIMMGEKCAVKFADEIIVLSRGIQDYFRDAYGRETRFIPNGVTRPEHTEPHLLREWYGLNGGDYILFLARLTEEKGIRYLIEAYRQIRTDKKLVIAGGASDSGEYIRELKALAEGDDRIVFTGFVQGKLLDELYSNAYLYVLPSDLEGMPLSLLEAMSYGNCCVVSDIPECTEVVEDHAVIFEAGNTEKLKEKLELLLEHPELTEEYKESSADFVCEKYNWDRVVDQTLELYRGEPEKRQQIYTYGSAGQISSPGSASSAAPHVMYMKSERGTDDRK